MSRKLLPEVARKFLGDVENDKKFWVNNGTVLKNLDELLDALNSMSNDTFQYHANSEKNDFSRWIGDVIGDKKLAEDLAKSKNKKSVIKILEFRINQLKRVLS